MGAIDATEKLADGIATIAEVAVKNPAEGMKWMARVIAFGIVVNLAAIGFFGYKAIYGATHDDVAKAIEHHAAHPHPGSVTKEEFKQLVGAFNEMRAELADMRRTAAEDSKQIRTELMRIYERMPRKGG